MSRPSVTLEAVHRLSERALAANAQRLTAISLEWDCAGNCMLPVPLTIVGRPSSVEKWSYSSYPKYDQKSGSLIFPPPLKFSRHGRGKIIEVDRTSPVPMYVDLWVRCRKCKSCLSLRRKMWAARAVNEVSLAASRGARTWFGTITLRPDLQDWSLHAARKRLADQGLDLDLLGFDEKFKERVRALSQHVTRYIKRVRKQSAAPLRYLWVAEAHQSGNPHFHALVHECDDQKPVRYRVLSDCWHDGFTKWNVVDDVAQATYLCKYLSKSQSARVRASSGYGNIYDSSLGNVNTLTPFQVGLLNAKHLSRHGI